MFWRSVYNFKQVRELNALKQDWLNTISRFPTSSTWLGFGLRKGSFTYSVNGVDSYIKCSWNGIIQGSILGPILNTTLDTFKVRCKKAFCRERNKLIPFSFVKIIEMTFGYNSCSQFSLREIKINFIHKHEVYLSQATVAWCDYSSNNFRRTRDRTPPPTLLLVNHHRRAKRNELEIA